MRETVLKKMDKCSGCGSVSYTHLYSVKTSNNQQGEKDIK